MVPWLVSLGEQDSNPMDSATHLSEIKVYLCGLVGAFYSCLQGCAWKNSVWVKHLHMQSGAGPRVVCLPQAFCP